MIGIHSSFDNSFPTLNKMRSIENLNEADKIVSNFEPTQNKTCTKWKSKIKYFLQAFISMITFG